jgi:hypothetical protein
MMHDESDCCVGAFLGGLVGTHDERGMESLMDTGLSSMSTVYGAEIYYNFNFS